MAQLAAQQLAHLLQKQQGSSALEQIKDEAKEWVLGCLQVRPSLCIHCRQYGTEQDVSGAVSS